MDKIRNAIKYSIEYHKIGEINHTVEFYFVDEIVSSRSLCMNEFTAGQFHFKSDTKSHIKIKSNRNVIGIIITIFHEITHLKQYLKKELIDTKFGTIWKGNAVPNTVDYYDKPYEVDARFHEIKIYRKWLLTRVVNLVKNLFNKIWM
jgi:hypothetical protein